jgi:hypothetical protein
MGPRWQNMCGWCVLTGQRVLVVIMCRVGWWSSRAPSKFQVKLRGVACVRSSCRHIWGVRRKWDGNEADVTSDVVEMNARAQRHAHTLI